jgi:DNA mismatch endonuclease, patch repair protein
MDQLSKEHRSWNMSRIRGRDTKPEMRVRSALHRLGFRFRLHVAHLPGRPDIVLPKYNTVVLVHGCFWHHHGCNNSKWPRTHSASWRKKLQDTIARDRRDLAALKNLGWRVFVTWECELDQSRLGKLATAIRRAPPLQRSSIKRHPVQ